MREAEANCRSRLPSHDRSRTALLRQEEGPGFPRGRRWSPLRVLRPLRCDMDWFRRLDLRLAVGDPDGAPVEGGGDVRSCRPDCCGGSGEHAPNKRRNCGGTPNTSHVTRYARTRTPTARDERILWWNGNDRAWVHTTFQESPRGADSARDTGDVHLGLAMARRVTPIPSGCHSPEPRAAAYLGRRPLYEYRIEPAFAQARFSVPDRG